MTQSRRDSDAEKAIKAVVVTLFGAAIEEVEVHAGEDHNDRPAIFVTIFMKAAQQIMSSSQWSDTLVATNHALRTIDDDRFAYLTFLAPEDESAEDTRPAA